MSKDKGDAKRAAKEEPAAGETIPAMEAVSEPPPMPEDAPAAAKADEPAKAEKSDKKEKGETSEKSDGRARSETMAMPVDVALGEAPAVPKAGSVEQPAFMPGPKDIPGGSPSDPGTVPGSTPPGDSRSMRRESEFALVYRQGTAVISRTGTAGTRGVWRVVEYPTSTSASNAYAKECSRFVAEGFSDYRD